MTKVGAGLNLVLHDAIEGKKQDLLFTVDLVPSFLIKVTANYNQLRLRQVCMRDTYFLRGPIAHRVTILRI